MNIWMILYRISCAILSVVAIIMLVVIFMPKINENKAMQRQSAILEEEIRTMENMTRELRYQQERFRTDPNYVERVAREKLGKSKPGEVIFRFTEPATNASLKTRED